MKILNPNYTIQFLVALLAAEMLMNARTPREKAAVLEGIVSITRTHFWEQGQFVAVTKTELVHWFNAVVSDRLKRFTNINQ